MRPHATPRIRASALALAAVLATVPGCKKAPVQVPAEIASSDEALFKLGEAETKKHFEKAILYLRQVIASFPKSFYAQRAKLLIADTYFKKGDEGNMILAAAESIRDVIAFPKPQKATDLLTEAPSAVDSRQLAELSLRVVARK